MDTTINVPDRVSWKTDGRRRFGHVHRVVSGGKFFKVVPDRCAPLTVLLAAREVTREGP